MMSSTQTTEDLGAPTRKLHPIDQRNCWKITGENEMHFHHWDLFWSDGENYFYSTYLNRILPEDISVLGHNAELIPRTSYEVSAPSNLTHAPAPQPEDSYIKRPQIQEYSPDGDGVDMIKRLLIQEALVCDKLAKHPHPNICEYRGYVLNEPSGYMAGLCFKRYSKNLDEAVKDGDTVDSKAIVEGIRLGLKHMHSLGLVHNDVNPTNIMLASSSWPVLVDFDSCQESGSTVKIKGGTPGWSKDASGELVVEENDWYGLEKIEAWLSEKAVNIHDEIPKPEFGHDPEFGTKILVS